MAFIPGETAVLPPDPREASAGVAAPPNERHAAEPVLPSAPPGPDPRPGPLNWLARRRPSLGGRAVPIAVSLVYVGLAVLWLIGPDLVLAAGLASQRRWLALIAGGGDVVFIAATGLLLYAATRRHFAQRLDAEARLRAVTEGAPAGLAVTDREGVLCHANATFLRLFGLHPSVTRAAMPLAELLVARLSDATAGELLPATGESRTSLRLRKDGHETEIALTATRVISTDPQLGWVVSATDVGEGRQFRRVHAINSRAIEMAADGIAVADLGQPDTPLVYVNHAFEAMTGYRMHELIGRNCRHLQGSDRLQPEIETIRNAIAERAPAAVTLRNYRKDGTPFWNELRLAPVFDESGSATHFVCVARDVSTARRTAEALQRIAYTDPLTGLANRPSFTEKLEAMLQDEETEWMLVVELDIQKFHEINSTAGYDVGDALLGTLAERLTRGLPEALIGRLSANEFAIAMRLADDLEGEAQVDAIRRLLGERFVLPGVTFDVFFAVGFAMVERSAPAKAAMRQASVALHEAKSAGTGETRRFDRATEVGLLGRVRLTAELQQASPDDDFMLHYQPKVDLSTGKITGAEALLRWRHPVFGVQPPTRFIPVAEQTGLVLEIGEWALKRAARFAAAVNRDRAEPLVFSVNVSPVQLRRRDMAKIVQRVLIEAGAEPAWLILELTESIFADLSPDMIARFRRLRDLGVGLSIDDFGTGYSSLRYLGSFPVTEIKLDRSFVAGLDGNAYNRTIVEAVLKVGADLRLGVIAEGVETWAERVQLLALGCRYAQGYLFSKPVDEAGFVALKDGPGLLPEGLRNG